MRSLVTGPRPPNQRTDWAIARAAYCSRMRRFCTPPSTASELPVVEPESGLARYAIALATSFGVTIRPVACRASSAARSAIGSSNFCNIRLTNGVSTVPGLTQLTRTPSRYVIRRHGEGERKHCALRRTIECALGQAVECSDGTEIYHGGRV